jgi:hypothetical protein
MESPTAPPPSANTSSRLVQFPESTYIEEKKPRKPVTSTQSSFQLNVLSCFGFFTSKPREKKPQWAQRVPERTILKAPTISTLSLSKMDSSIEAKPYKWPHDSSFDPKTTALVIIDMQKDCECLTFHLIVAHPTFTLTTITCAQTVFEPPFLALNYFASMSCPY